MKNILLYALCAVAFGQCHYSTCAEEVITNPRQYDGFGSQLQSLVASVIYAELVNKKFAYRPFKKMAHNYNGDDRDHEFIAQKEELINFKNNFDPIDKNDTSKKYIAHTGVFYKTFVDKNMVQCSHSHSLRKIRRIFRENKNTENYFNNENFNIVVHVRRPNSHDNRILGTDTPDGVFINTIDKLRVIYAEKNPLFHVHSQGNSEQFAAYIAPDIVLHLDESLEDSFTAMVLADVLVTSASCLSYMAGFLSEGTVYYMPYWHTPMPHWISVNSI
jgi:hypothetical protein